MMTLRALRARSGQSLALFTMGVLAVAGCVFAVGYSRATHVSVGSAGALLLLGAFAIAAQANAFVRNQRHEIGLAQLHGRHGFRLLWYAVKRPAVVLLAATGVGLAMGWVVTRAAVHRWVGPEATFTMATYEWAAAAIVFAVSVTMVVVVGWSMTYEPLAAKLDNLARPRAMTAPAVFLSLLVLVGAAVSVYQARQLSPRNASWVSYLSPALVGLAAGQIGVWLVALLSRIAIASPRLDRRLGWFLTWRRLSRRADSVVLIRIAVAAAVVAGVAANAWAGSAAWRDQTARVETGGPVAFTVPTGGLQAYAASHEADPHGRWLMAMSGSPDASASSYRGIFVDTPRWDRVVGAFFSGTPVAQVTNEIAAMSPGQAVRPVRGTDLHMTFTANSVRRAWSPSNSNLAGLGEFRVRFTVSYVDSNGTTQSLQVPVHPGQLPSPIRPGVVGYSAFIPGCSRACAVERVTVQGLTRRSPLRITGMSFAGMRLLPADVPGLTLAKSSTHFRAVPSHRGLKLSVTSPHSPQPLLIWRRGTTPALVTPGLRLEHDGGMSAAYGLDGTLEPVHLTGEVAALPLLGRAGLLLDLGTDLLGAGPQGVETKTVVVARADTPPRVLRKLAATGAVAGRHTVQQALAVSQRSETGRRTAALYALIAVFGLLIAAVSVVSSTAAQRRQRRTEAASLRTVGVDSTEVARGYRVEAATLGVAVTVVAAVATWIACRALLAYLPLVHPGQFGLLFDATPRADLAAAVAVLAGLMLALVVFADFRLVGRASPPSTLRDENR
jgi:FtsX-like permease family